MDPAPSAPQVVAPQRPQIDPDMAELFREEREYESKRRAAQADPLESQPELGLAAPQPAPQPAPHPVEPTAAIGAAAVTGRARLPDVEEINQTLRSTNQPRAVDMAARHPVEDYDDTPTKGGGFLRGFALIVILVALGIGLYTAAPRISAAVPALEDPLNRYVSAMNSGRAWLDGQVADVLKMLDGMSSEAGDSDG